VTPEGVDELVAATEAAVTTAAAAVADLLVWLTREWTTQAGRPRTALSGAERDAILDELKRRVAALDDPPTEQLDDAFRKAYREEYGRTNPRPLLSVRDSGDDMLAAVHRRRDLTTQLLDELGDADESTFYDVRRALKPALAEPAEVRSAGVRATMAGQHAGVTARALREGTQVIVEPERNACLYCLSFAGAVADPNTDFTPRPDYLPEVPVPWLRPQFHPSCRCRLRLYRKSNPGDELVREALVREADRAVLRGTTEYGSEAARFRAAGRLLEQIGAGKVPARVPVTVRRAGQQAVKRGKFPDHPDRTKGTA
jgi:hypothetical protein